LSSSNAAYCCILSPKSQIAKFSVIKFWLSVNILLYRQKKNIRASSYCIISMTRIQASYKKYTQFSNLSCLCRIWTLTQFQKGADEVVSFNWLFLSLGKIGNYLFQKDEAQKRIWSLLNLNMTLKYASNDDKHKGFWCVLK
jgi:hypothetical protein